MKSNVEAVGYRLFRFKVVGLPMNLGIKIVAIRIEMPASKTNNRILIGSIDNLHIANCRIVTKTALLFIEVKS